jgi:hypothetical protein
MMPSPLLAFRRTSRSVLALVTRFLVLILFCLGLVLCFPSRAAAQETPYFVAYSHHLEEPGNLEVEVYSIYGTQKAGGDFIAPWMELEYGVTAWWTTEFYIDSQTTHHVSQKPWAPCFSGRCAARGQLGALNFPATMKRGVACDAGDVAKAY